MAHHYACYVRWSDVDAYGHVNNVKYFEYFQEARIAFMTSLAEDAFSSRGTFVVARQGVHYLRPLLFRREPYDIVSKVRRVGTSSYDLSAQIVDGTTVLSRCSTTVVAFDRDQQRSRRLDDWERAALLAMQED